MYVCMYTYPVPKSALWDYLMKTFNKEKYLTKRKKKSKKKKKFVSNVFFVFFFSNSIYPE